ncbi:hypothetical protein LZ554_000179 [Drepanopeziza brunnea f. sp. 'monogermtubi']|nr:hypothetical protein LZ554_000179 [Drepanopeziza brunnea f. sp. 'monogermtubi']
MVSLAFIAALSTFVAIALAKAIAEPITTPAPVFPRQNVGQDFVGYYAYGSGYDSAICRIGSTWTASSTYGRCCPTGLTCAAGDFITKCSGNTIVFGDGYTSSCSGSFSICNTDQIFQTLNDASPTFWIGCDDDGLETNYYRTRPAAATAPAPVTSASKPIKTSSAPLANTPRPITPPGGVTTPTSLPKSKPFTKSTAFIAVIVAGPIILIIIIALVTWILCIKKKSKSTTQHQVPQQPVLVHNQPSMAPTPQEYQAPTPDRQHSAAPTYQAPYQPLGVQSPIVSSMGSPQSVHTGDGKIVNSMEKKYFPPDKTPAITTNQVPGPGSNPADIYPPHSELQ